MTVSRRQFLKLAAGAAAGAALARPRTAWGGPEEADLVLTGGAIVTMNDAAPFATAMAVKGGRVLALGADDAIRAHAGPRTQVIDLAVKVGQRLAGLKQASSFGLFQVSVCFKRHEDRDGPAFLGYDHSFPYLDKTADNLRESRFGFGDGKNATHGL